MTPANPPLRWRALSLPKEGYGDDECEDAWAADPAAGRFAVADGASESLFAGLWARLLAEAFVAARLPDDVTGWLKGPRRRWSEEVMGLELPWYAEMKREQGAFATFLGLDLRPPAGNQPGSWQAVAVGDTCLVRVRRPRHFQSFPVRKAADFGDRPPLIGTGAGAPRCQRCSGSFRRGDRFFLMTDALAQWFLGACERGGRPWKALAAVLSAPRPREAFAEWVEGLRGSAALRDDDVTLLMIDARLPKE
jgi:hypothetical protein